MTREKIELTKYINEAASMLDEDGVEALNNELEREAKYWRNRYDK